MTKTRLVILGTLSLLLIILILIYLIRVGKEKIEQASSSILTDIDQSSEKPKEKKKILLFFLSEIDARLYPEEREIYENASVVVEAKQAIEELIKGSEKGYLSPLPPQTKVIELFLTKEGVAYIDFSKDFQEEHPSGSSAEISTVYSVVNTLTYNFKPIKEVFILIEGREKETLGGHINLTRPFLPKYNLIAR